MELLTGVVCFLQIVDLIFKVKDRVIVPADRQALQEYLQQVGNLLNAVATDMQNQHYPHDKCQQMLFHLNNIESVLRNKIDLGLANSLQSMLQQAYQVERLFGELQTLSAQQQASNIESVKGAAGAFIAASYLVKI